MGLTESVSVSASTRPDYLRRLETFQREMAVPDLHVAAAVLDSKLVKSFDQTFLAGFPFGAGQKLLAAEVYASLTAAQRKLCHRADDRLISMLRRKVEGATS